MKLSLIVSALLATAVALPAAANPAKIDSVEIFKNPFTLPLERVLDDDLLYPKPKIKIPGFGPACLSCPDAAILDQSQILVLPRGW